MAADLGSLLTKASCSKVSVATFNHSPPSRPTHTPTFLAEPASEMHTSYVRAAQSISSKPLNLHQALSAAIYPPIPLYRRLLRAHRRLPIEMRSLGDAYVKDEFRRHREVTNPVHIMGFLTQWKMYLDELPHDPRAKNFKKLDSTVFEKMSAEQLGQLYELMHASKDVWKPVSEDGFDLGHSES